MVVEVAGGENKDKTFPKSNTGNILGQVSNKTKQTRLEMKIMDNNRWTDEGKVSSLHFLDFLPLQCL